MRTTCSLGIFVFVSLEYVFIFLWRLTSTFKMTLNTTINLHEPFCLLRQLLIDASLCNFHSGTFPLINGKKMISLPISGWCM